MTKRDNQTIEKAIKILENRMYYFLENKESFTSTNAAKDYFKLKLADRKNEVFAIIFLTNRHVLIAYEEMFFGTVNGASVHPREVVRKALEHNCSAVIIAHNPPSGESHPSRSDETITRRLKDILNVIDVSLLDHLVIGKTVTSMAEQGLI